MTSFNAFAEEYFAAPAARPAVRRAAASVPVVDAFAFTHALIALSAKLSAVDGAPTKAEYLAFTSLFLNPGDMNDAQVRSLFVKHVSERSSALQYARQLVELTAQQVDLRHEIFARLVRVATADGMLNAAEMELLHAVGGALKLPAEFVRATLENCFTASGQSPYDVLGISAKADDAAVRAAYMAQVHQLHPDRFQAAGASAQTVAMLSQQLAAVNAAYENVCRARAKKFAFSNAASRLSQSVRGAKTQRSAKAVAA